MFIFQNGDISELIFDGVAREMMIYRKNQTCFRALVKAIKTYSDISPYVFVNEPLIVLLESVTAVVELDISTIESLEHPNVCLLNVSICLISYEGSHTDGIFVAFKLTPYISV